MAVYLADENGVCGQLASNKGYADLVAFCRKFPYISSFFRDGVSKEPEKIVDAVDQVLRTRGIDKDIADVARNLKQMAAGKEIIIIQ